MKYLTIGLLILGLALLGLILYQTDLTEVWNLILKIGFLGIIVILSVHFVSFLLQTLSWHLTLPFTPAGKKWFYELWKVLIVGDALNNVTPLASVGGEPVKAALLKKHYGIGYKPAAASLLLQLTVQNLGLVPFLIIGFLLMLGTDVLPPAYHWTAGIGLTLFSFCMVMFYLVQRYQAISRTVSWLGRHYLDAILDHVHEFEGYLMAFYNNYRRFIFVLLIELGIWSLTVVEVYFALYFLGHPVGWGDAWTIAAVVALVHAVLFFVPANIGTQEGAFVLVCSAITGSAALGLAVALIVRFRELFWMAVGLFVGWLFALMPDKANAESETEVIRTG